MLFPLPDHQLPRVNIDAQTIVDWKAEAQDAVAHVLMDRSSWHYCFDECDPSFTRGYDKNGARGSTRVLPGTTDVEYLSQGELHMTLDDVVYAMTCDTTQQQRALLAQLYQDVCVDTAILQLCEGARADDPFHRVAMIWAILHPEKLPLPQDYIHFQMSFTTADAEGRPVLALYRKAHDLRPGQLIRDHGLEIDRKYTFALTTFRAAAYSGPVIMTVLGHVDLNTKFSTRVFKRIMPTVFKRTLNHHKIVHARNLELIGITADTLCDRNHSQTSMCRVCHKSFGYMIRRRKWCQGCGHAMCRNCNMEIALLKDGVQLGPRLLVVLARFCLRCLLHASEQRIKSDVAREKMLSSETQSRVYWWENINVVDENCVDGLLDAHRETLGLRRGDLHQKSSVAETDVSFSTSDSGPEEESSLASAIAKAEELTLIAAFVAENTAQLRQIHRQRHLENHT